MSFISFTEAARRKEASRSTLYRAADDGRINAEEVAGRRLVLDDAAFADYEPRNVGARAARHQSNTDDG